MRAAMWAALQRSRHRPHPGRRHQTGDSQAPSRSRTMPKGGNVTSAERAPHWIKRSRWRRWLRLGPSRRQLIRTLNREVAENHERGIRISQLKSERGRLRQEIATIMKRLTQLQRTHVGAIVEPPPDRTGRCQKVRLHTEDEATAWAQRIEQRFDQQPGSLGPYLCTVCPVHPATASRFWHAGHSSDPQAQAEKRASIECHRAAVRDGRLIGDRIDPSVLDRILRTRRTP